MSPDGKWMWDGKEWIPAPPSLPPSPQPTSYHTVQDNYSLNGPQLAVNDYTQLQFDNEFYHNDFIQISPRKSNKKLTIAISILATLLILFAIIGVLILSEELEPEDDVVLSYIYAHSCDRVLATYSDANGDAVQDFDYYEGDIIIIFDGKMSAGDEMLGGIIVDNFDDESCFITVTYNVQINGGDIITLKQDGPNYCEQYEGSEVFYNYIHE
tara:strand:- start:287 stop:922 length:636 start_codon:yes stop_codon:yes gene_type:complete